MTYSSESAFQRDLIRGLRTLYPGWLVFHPPNEAQRSKIMGHLMKIDGLLPGIPDIVIARDNGAMAWIECKLARKTLSFPQRVALRQLSAINHAVVVAYADDGPTNADARWLAENGILHVVGYEGAFQWVRGL